MPRYTAVSQSARDSSNVAVSAERLVNCYAEAGPGDGRSRLVLRTVPGESAFSSISSANVRAASPVGDYIFIAANGYLYRVNETGTAENLGGIIDSEDTTISAHGQDATVTAGGTYYVWDDSASTLTEPTGAAFDDAGSVTYLNSVTLFSESGGRRFQWSDVLDPLTLDALNFATADGRNDNILRVMADKTKVWIYGETSIEVWYRVPGASGSSSFARLPDGIIDQGLKSYKLLSRHDAGMFFVGNDDVVYETSSGLKPISTAPVNTALKDGTPTHCSYYEHRGHKFCVVRFSDRPAWCYDLTTGLWHERASGVNFDAWTCVEIVSHFDKWYSISRGGGIYEMAEVSADVAGHLKRGWTSRTIYLDGKKFSVSEVEFLCQMGATDLGRDAMVSMRYSRDGGKTFSPEIMEPIGDLGEYENRVIYRSLGNFVSFTAEFTITDPEDIPMYSDVNVEIT